MLERSIHLEIEEDHFRASTVLAITRATMSLVQEVVFVCVHLHERSDDECLVYTQFDGQSHRSFDEGADIRRKKNQIVHWNRSKRRRLAEGANVRGVEMFCAFKQIEAPQATAFVCRLFHSTCDSFYARFFADGSDKVFDAVAQRRGEKVMPSTVQNITALLLHRLGVRL